MFAKLVIFTSPLKPQNALRKVTFQWETVLGTREALSNTYLVRRSEFTRISEKFKFCKIFHLKTTKTVGNGLKVPKMKKCENSIFRTPF